MNESDVTQLATSIKNAFIDALPVDLPMDIRNNIAASYTPLCNSMAGAIRVFTETAIAEAVSAATQNAHNYVDSEITDHLAESHAPDPTAGTVPPHVHDVASQIWSHQLMNFIQVDNDDVQIEIPVSNGIARTTPRVILGAILQAHALQNNYVMNIQGTTE